MENKLKFRQSHTNIHDYSNILDKLYPDFGNHFCHTILCWCGIMEKGRQPDKSFWEVWIIYNDKMQSIGICGLYSLKENSTDELWLGWFGLFPEYRNKGLGVEAIQWLKLKAKSLGASKLMAYVDKNRKPMSFYLRNGFKEIGTVSEYVKVHNLSLVNFESKKDYVIQHTLK